MRSLTLYLFSFILIVIIFTSCDDTLNGDQIDSIVIPERNVSYFDYIQPVFNYKCNYSGCHDHLSAAGGLVLESWTQTTGDPSMVFPYQPDNSRLVWAIEGQTGLLMPPYGYYALTQNQIDGIKTWIAEGAQNN
jgi:hypothetical protein